MFALAKNVFTESIRSAGLSDMKLEFECEFRGLVCAQTRTGLNELYFVCPEDSDTEWVCSGVVALQFAASSSASLPRKLREKHDYRKRIKREMWFGRLTMMIVFGGKMIKDKKILSFFQRGWKETLKFNDCFLDDGKMINFDY